MPDICLHANMHTLVERQTGTGTRTRGHKQKHTSIHAQAPISSNAELNFVTIPVLFSCTTGRLPRRDLLSGPVSSSLPSTSSSIPTATDTESVSGVLPSK